ncbi:MAG TPA: AarF/ABC1/UbiB kinase family protein [Candidatus Eisenbacteria bacterium]|nr:AarF/ABC1/UbiB kinase family protein [Candidatus Eisenbacteria bacterium]
MPALFGWKPATSAGALARSRRIAAVFTGHGLGSLLDRTGLARLPFPRRGAPAERLSEARRLRLAFGELGGTFVKLGQMLSTRGDLLPLELVDELATLTDAAPPVPFAGVRGVIEADLGRPLERAFAAFEEQPLASASIGQVHGARLPGGADVVVKVRRPFVAEQVEQDLAILGGLARWAREHTLAGAELDLPALVDEFAFTLRGELDYRQEARNAARLRAGFAGRPEVWIPGVHAAVSSARVLVLDRARGLRIADLAALDRAGIPRRAVAENAVRIFLHEVLELGFFHADPHVGNFFVRPDGSLELVDFGMTGRVSPELRDRLLRLGLAAIHRDAGDIVEQLFALGLAGHTTARAEVTRDVERLLDRYAGVTVGQLAAADVVRELSALAYQHRLRLPTDLALLARVLAMSEGLGLRLDPTFQFFEFASPLLRRHWRARTRPAQLVRRAGRALAEAAELGAGLPGRAGRLLARLERGELDMQVRHEGLSRFSHDLQGMANRIAIAVVLGATIVALGLALVVVHPAGWGRLAGQVFGIAFTASLAFGAWLMLSIWRSGRRGP